MPGSTGVNSPTDAGDGVSPCQPWANTHPRGPAALVCRTGHACDITAVVMKQSSSKRVPVLCAAMIFCGAGLGACQPPSTPPAAQPPSSEPSGSPGALPAFETPGPLPASMFFPPSVLQGVNYSVNPVVMNDGIYNTWTVTSDFGTYETTGDERLLVLLREIAAIAAIRAQSGIVRFGESAAQAGAGTLEKAKTIIENPVGTVRGLPQGAARFLGRVGQTVRHAAEGNLDVPTGGGAGAVAQQFLGVDKAKRVLAAQLGVNVYSKNAALQSALNDAAWTMAMGQLTFKVGTSLLLPFAAGMTITGVNVASSLSQEQIEASPKELMESVRGQFAALGVAPDVIEALCDNPDYDPWLLASMANSLQAAGATGADLFAAKASSATTELDAYYSVRVASLLVQYGKTQPPVTAIESAGASVVCRDAANHLVVPLWADYIEWTPTLDAATTRLLERVGTGQRSGAVIFATGRWSPSASAALGLRGIPIPHASSDLPADVGGNQ